VAFDDGGTPFWQGHGALFIDDIMILSLDIAYVEMMSQLRMM
jgi:hypothetical protein